jgi:hypothetical protein
MQDPVVAADGNSYERAAIDDWLRWDWCTSPLNNEPLPHTELIPNRELKRVIQELEEQMLDGQREMMGESHRQHDVKEIIDKFVIRREAGMAPEGAMEENFLSGYESIDNLGTFIRDTIQQVEYGGNFTWVGARYRLRFQKGFAPLQWLNSLTSQFLSLTDLIFTADGGFRRPGEFQSLFPQKGVNLRWRWNAETSRVIIDFSSEGELLSWRWDELQPLREFRFPSTAPDLKGIGHVGRFTFKYVMVSSVAEESESQEKESWRNSSLLGSPSGCMTKNAISSSRTDQLSRHQDAALHLQIGDRCVAVNAMTLRAEQDLTSDVVREISAGAILYVQELGTQPRRVKIITDEHEGWVSFVTAAGAPLLSKQASPKATGVERDLPCTENLSVFFATGSP